MEMQMEVLDELRAGSLGVGSVAVDQLIERLTAAAGQLEQAAERLAGREVSMAASIDRAADREAELERLLAQAEAAATSFRSSRKTQPAGVTNLLAKENPGVEAGALDTALTGLSPEQRIAVKAQLLRSGLVG